MRELMVVLIWTNTCSRYRGTMVLQGQALTSGPSDLPSERSSLYMGRSADFLPEYCSSTYWTAVARYLSGESSSVPFPSARPAIHRAELVPSLCLDLSHARRACESLGPSFFTSAIHSSRDRPVLGFNSTIHFWTMATPG